MIKAQLSHDAVRAVFAPIVDIIALKLIDQNAAFKAAEEYYRWCFTAMEGDPDEHLAKGAKLEEILEKHSSHYRAFKDIAKDDLERWQFHKAADYTDLWISGKDTRFVVYYRCGVKWNPNTPYEECCNTITRTDCWRQKHDDPLAKGQKWYC